TQTRCTLLLELRSTEHAAGLRDFVLRRDPHRLEGSTEARARASLILEAPRGGLEERGWPPRRFQQWPW
ncbi:hypothetical protein ACC723_37890, partial [Rhizobium ruizarguesonis]